MTDTLDTAVRTALRDIIATAPIAERRPTPIDLVHTSGDRSRRGIYLAIAATLVIVVGAAGILSIDSKRSGPASTPANSSGRPNGVITDPRAIDLSPWLSGAPEWPSFQPEYLVFDIAAIAGWTKLDESGVHYIGQGWSYVWTATVSDADGHRFYLVMSDSIFYPRVVSGETVDINGAAGIATDGELSWPVDTSHIASVTDLGTADNKRAIALARQLTTTTVPTISMGGLGNAPEITPDPAAPFAGVVDGYAWSASATPDSMTFTLDQTLSQTYERLPGISTTPVEIRQFGNNDICVFIAGYLPDVDTTVRLILSDKTTISLPTQLLADGEQWFATCVPYALDATLIETHTLNGEPVLHQLNWPLLRPTFGSSATDTDLSTEVLAKSLISGQDAELGCGSTFADQAVMVASAPRADGNRLQLWAAPTSTGATTVFLMALAHNGALLTPSGTCSVKDTGGMFSYNFEEDSVRFIDLVGRTDPNATQANVTFSSGKVVLVDVQTDGYFILSIIDDAHYGYFKSVEPID